MTSPILALRDHLASEQVTCVVMEATSDYWKPFYYLLEDLPGPGDCVLAAFGRESYLRPRAHACIQVARWRGKHRARWLT